MNAQMLSCKFSELLQKELSKEEFEVMITRNEKETDNGICHSHDFCDANQVMLNAMEALGIDNTFPLNVPLINEAWDISKEKNFMNTAGSMVEVEYQVKDAILNEFFSGVHTIRKLEAKQAGNLEEYQKEVDAAVKRYENEGADFAVNFIESLYKDRFENCKMYPEAIEKFKDLPTKGYNQNELFGIL